MNQLSLVGTSRTVDFKPGLNVVLGDVTTGKTSLMRLLRVLLGSAYGGIIPELSHVSDLASELVIGDEVVSVVRRLTQTPTAPVDLASETYSGRLPAQRPKKAGDPTYGSWILDRLQLPRIRVPTAPSRPAESGTTPVSVADYLRYCRLTQDEIAVDVLGSSEWPKDYKRRVVFRIYFGSYDAEIAELQEQLRDVESRLRSLRHQTHAFDEFLEGTVLANRAELEGDLREAEAAVAAAEEKAETIADGVSETPRAAELRSGLLGLESDLQTLSEQLDAERVASAQSEELAKQLRAQSARLTQAVVASSHFVDYEFRVCPRCSQTIDSSRSSGDDCYLCLQSPGEQLTREDLLVEQTRIESQIEETDGLAATHARSAAEIAEEERKLREARAARASELDELVSTYVSDRAETISALSAERSTARARVDQLQSYLELLEKADAARVSVESLETERASLEDRLDVAEQIDQLAESRILRFEELFQQTVENLRLPRFTEDAEPRAAIHRGDFEPIVNGRRIERHSGGMAVLINVAYMIAFHRAAIELDLAVPSILMVDGINQNFGKGEYDNERYEGIWKELLNLGREHGERLQVVVATNDVPRFVEDADVVRVRLTETDRLVPLAHGGT